MESEGTRKRGADLSLLSKLIPGLALQFEMLSFFRRIYLRLKKQ